MESNRLLELFNTNTDSWVTRENESVRINENNIDELGDHPQCKVVNLVGLKQKAFDYFIKNYGAQCELISIDHCNNISDLSPLGKLANLKYIKINWNNKSDHLWDLSNNKTLIGIECIDFKKIHDLNEILSAPSLEAFKLHQVDKLNSLRPLTKTKIRHLEITFSKLEDEDIEPLTQISSLEYLSFGTVTFTTEQVAWLKANLPDVKSDVLAPYIELNKDTVLIIGKRKPMLKKEKDQERIKKYISKFEDLISSYSK